MPLGHLMPPKRLSQRMLALPKNEPETWSSFVQIFRCSEPFRLRLGQKGQAPFEVDGHNR
jgi:hypothetical protein